MKFFKHFSDARTRTGMQLILDKYGPDGYGCYFILVEMCTAKWDMKEPGWECCEFKFSWTQVQREFRCRRTKVALKLNSYAVHGLMNWTADELIIVIKFPKLLKFLDKDSKYNRNRIAQKSLSTTLDKEEEEEEEEERESVLGVLDFRPILERYPKPGASTFLDLCTKTVRTKKEFSAFAKAIENYAHYVRESKIEQRYVKSFQNFMKEWREWSVISKSKNEISDLLERLQKEKEEKDAHRNAQRSNHKTSN